MFGDENALTSGVLFIFILLGFGVQVGVFGGIGAAIGDRKDRRWAGFWYGMWLGPLGWIIAALLRPSAKARAELAKALNPPKSQGAWWPDPKGRHQHRYWDGTRWTENVSDGGIPSIDRLSEQPATASARIARDKDAYGSLQKEYPTVFDAVWECADRLDYWPDQPAVWLRRACQKMKEGVSAADAVATCFPPSPRA